MLATPVMIAWMEGASLNLVQKELENGLTTVGTEVNIKHLKGTLVGKTVKVVSVLKEIDRKKGMKNDVLLSGNYPEKRRRL